MSGSANDGRRAAYLPTSRRRRRLDCPRTPRPWLWLWQCALSATRPLIAEDGRRGQPQALWAETGRGDVTSRDADVLQRVCWRGCQWWSAARPRRLQGFRPLRRSPCWTCVQNEPDRRACRWRRRHLERRRGNLPLHTDARGERLFRPARRCDTSKGTTAVSSPAPASPTLVHPRAPAQIQAYGDVSVRPPAIHHPSKQRVRWFAAPSCSRPSRSRFRPSGAAAFIQPRPSFPLQPRRPFTAGDLEDDACDLRPATCLASRPPHSYCGHSPLLIVAVALCAAPGRSIRRPWDSPRPLIVAAVTTRPCPALGATLCHLASSPNFIAPTVAVDCRCQPRPPQHLAASLSVPR